MHTELVEHSVKQKLLPTCDGARIASDPHAKVKRNASAWIRVSMYSDNEDDHHDKNDYEDYEGVMQRRQHCRHVYNFDVEYSSMLHARISKMQRVRAAQHGNMCAQG